MGVGAPVFYLSFFMPSIIKEMNYTNVTSELLAIPPCVGSGLIAMLSSWNASRLNENSNHIMLFLLIGMSGFLCLILTENYLYVGVCIASIGVYTTYALFPSWVTSNRAGQTKRAIVIALVHSFDSIGGIISGQIYRSQDDPLSFRRGHYIVLGIMCSTFILVLLLKLLLMCENRRRGNLRPEEHPEEDVADERRSLLGKVNFVYMISFFQ